MERDEPELIKNGKYVDLERTVILVKEKRNQLQTRRLLKRITTTIRVEHMN